MRRSAYFHGLPIVAIALPALPGCGRADVDTTSTTGATGGVAGAPGQGGSAAGVSGTGGAHGGSGQSGVAGQGGAGGQAAGGSAAAGAGGATAGSSGLSGTGGSQAGAAGSGATGGTGIPPSTCGDGMKTGIEACDGSDLGGSTCETVIAKGSTGALGCSADCMQFDVSGCSGEVCSMAGTQPGAPWPMHARCPSRAGRSPLVGALTPTIKWTLPLAGNYLAVGADTLYMAGGTIPAPALYAINLDGTLKWTFVADIPGAALAPAIGVDGTVYMTVGGIAGGVTDALYAVSEAGVAQWSLKFAGKGNTGSPALGPDGTIYLPTKGALNAIDKDGNVKWKVVGEPTGPDLPGVPSPPSDFADAAVGPDGTVHAVQEGGELDCYDAAGTLVWKALLGTSASASCLSIANSGNIYTGTHGMDATNLYLTVFQSDGQPLWSFLTSGPLFPQASIAADGTAIFSSDTNGTAPYSLLAVAPGGAQIWKHGTQTPSGAPIAIGADGTAYFGAGASVQAVSNKGDILWSLGAADSAAIGGNRTLYAYGAKSLFAIGP